MMARTGDWADVMYTVRNVHDKYQRRESGAEVLTYRLSMMAKELGEISAGMAKGGNGPQLLAELSVLLILLMGTAIASVTDLHQAFWDKIGKLMTRSSKSINGRIRVPDIHDVD